MEETVIVIMIKDVKTGYLDSELGSYKISKNDIYLVNITAEHIDTGFVADLKVSCGKEVSDWEFEAVYDYYDESVFEGLVISVNEIEDCFDPTWQIKFDLPEDIGEAETLIGKLLDIHASEIEDVFRTIIDKKEEYL